MSGDAQENGCGVRRQIYKKGAPQQEPDEGDCARDCCPEGVRVQWSCRQTSRSLRNDY